MERIALWDTDFSLDVGKQWLADGHDVVDDDNGDSGGDDNIIAP